MTYTQLKSELGRRGGKAAALSKRRAKASRLAAERRQWPPCEKCGAPTHLGLCPACDD